MVDLALPRQTCPDLTLGWVSHLQPQGHSLFEQATSFLLRVPHCLSRWLLPPGWHSQAATAFPSPSLGPVCALSF